MKIPFEKEKEKEQKKLQDWKEHWIEKWRVDLPFEHVLQEEYTYFLDQKKELLQLLE